MGWGTFGEIRNGSEDPPRVREGLETIGEVRNGLCDLRGGSGRVGGPSRRFGTGRGILGDVQDGSVDPLRGLGR